jgi:two-component system sensor histidine kinase VanS
LKNKQKQKPDYSALERKVYLRIVLITFLAMFAVWVIVLLTNNRMADFIVEVLQFIFSLTYHEALTVYVRVIRNNMTFIIIGTAIIFFIILAKFLLTQFAKYFNEITKGLDNLVSQSDEEIKLSAEMLTMERKLNAIKQTLAEREQEVKIAEQRKNDVVMYLAHDIKTPLTSVIGYLSLLDEIPDMPLEQKAKYVNITREKAQRLEKLVDEFFEITRYNFQTVKLSKENIDLHYMLVQMIDEFYPLLTAKGQKTVFQVPEDLIVYGDSDKLARVFNNILKNAIVYSDDHSTIEITGTVSENMISIEFKNAGSIPKEQLESIFDKFYRLDAARSSRTGGAGLVLAIAKEIIILHGGEIFATSDEGQTVFTIKLPKL